MTLPNSGHSERLCRVELGHRALCGSSPSDVARQVESRLGQLRSPASRLTTAIGILATVMLNISDMTRHLVQALMQLSPNPVARGMRRCFPSSRKSSAR
jgi:hypothetical protein